MPDDLRLNSIARFSKASSRLHLEEHGSCEVPAGCGGVVLRWYNPAHAVPVLFVMYAPAPPRIFLNGVIPASARPLVPRGDVVLAMEFDAVADEQALFVIAGLHSKTLRFDEEAICVLRSLSDGSWRFNVTRPPEGWMLPGFADDVWPQLIERPLNPPKADDYRGRYAHERLAKVGAKPLGLPANATPIKVWIRKVFRNTGDASA